MNPETSHPEPPASMHSDSVPGDPTGDPTSARRKRRLRFTLLDLMLLTLLIGTWLPAYLSRRQLPELRDEVEQMRAMTDHLPVLDATKLCVRELPEIWHQVHGWKYYLPEDAAMELRLATEQINLLGDPGEFDAVPLPTGIHTVHLKHDTAPDRSYVTMLFIDDELVVTRKHPPDWVDSHGSTSSGGTSSETSIHPLDETLVLRRMQYSLEKPHRKYSTLSLPEGYDAKGHKLWIAPRGTPAKTSPLFVTPESIKYRPFWGHRQGIRLRLNSQPFLNGLLMVQPDVRTALNDDNMFGFGRAVAGISVRPRTANFPQGESPENLPSKERRFGAGLQFRFHDSLEGNQGADGDAKGVFSEDGKRMRVFVHYEAFPSGAKPIVEVIFDAERPNQIGFLPHQSADSTPIEAIELVSGFGQLMQWRRVDLLPEVDEGDTASKDASDATATAIQTLFSDDKAVDRWNGVPLSRLPTIDADGTEKATKALRITTDVDNFLTVFQGTNVPGRWKYEGLPLCQTWYLPDGNDAASVRIFGSDTYPGTKVKVPGGAVIENVGVVVPMPAEEPVWLEFDAANPSVLDAP